jgi:hypothetical protein
VVRVDGFVTALLRADLLLGAAVGGAGELVLSHLAPAVAAGSAVLGAVPDVLALPGLADAVAAGVLEFVRVLKSGGVVVIEVPGKHKGGGDYNYFTCIEDVLEPFAPHVGECLWKEYSLKEENTLRFDITRVIFRVDKPAR